MPVALEELAGDPVVTPELLASAEVHLVEIAPKFPARQLRILARRVLDVIAPDISEAAEARALEVEERRAEEALNLSFIPSPEGLVGVTEVRFRAPDAVVGRLRTYLEAITAPRAAALTPEDVRAAAFERRPYSRRMGEAFCVLLEALNPGKLPMHGGTATTVMVTIPLADLCKELGAASISTGTDGDLRITAREARRLACTASIIPVVLGGQSEILDLGRSSRLFTAAQHRAMALRDRTCRAEGCTVPAAWCEAHHFEAPWSRGGKTDLDDGRLFCRWHHQRAHDDRYLHSQLPKGDVRFARRR